MPQEPIRAIVGRFTLGYSRAVIEAVMKERSFAFVAQIATGVEPQYVRGLPHSEQRWFISSEIRGCHYRGTDWSALAPLDEELVESMRPCESVFMDLVSRLEWKKSVSYDVRRRWYLRHLRFWNDFLTRHRINLYLSAWVPHEIPDLLIYELCKHRGIPTLWFADAMVQDTCFLERDWRASSPALRERYEELLRTYPEGTDPLSIALEPRFEHTYAALSSPKGEKGDFFKITYWQSVCNLLRRNTSLFFKHGVDYLAPRGWWRAFNTWTRWRHVRSRRAFYDAHVVLPDLAKPFIYMPLHFQPEASTVPRSGSYADQILMAGLLDASLPADAFIYVKEHPWESGWLQRSIPYYQELLSIPKVRLLPRTFDTFQLREHCIAVATGTGSAGFEGLFRGKPVLLFGHTFYQFARGVFSVRTKEDCSRAIREIFAGREQPTSLSCRLFLKAMEETSVHGILDPFLFRKKQITDEENVHAFREAIVRELTVPQP
ncbi:hypothetical protein A2412_02675 [Candidatus Peribacteria bacterium RIFOXYC1_FULL_58_8]|nr:MAG: hypothetical protein A2412_02675 [Candidatus Peribacteria bacterium RIFOXYC1_FULL_58_8]